MILYICKIFLWFIFYSIIGWIYETILVSCMQKNFVNRGFLNGPYCPIYGSGALIVIFLLDKDVGYAALFTSSMVLTCTLEYITSYVLEKIFHSKWWDYSSHRFNLNGRVCLEGALVFGLMSVIVVKFVHPLIEKYTDCINDNFIYIAALILFLLFIYDSVITVRHLLHLKDVIKKIHEALEKTKYDIEEKIEHKAEEMEEYKENIHFHIEKKRDFIKHEIEKAKLSYQEKYSLKNFPQFKSIDYEELSEKIKEILKK